MKIADNGPGVPEKNRAHIFEPFFTTKEDVGTGLGLWVSKEIERHGGKIEISSDHHSDLGGAVFVVFLPYEAQLETTVEQHRLLESIWCGYTRLPQAGEIQCPLLAVL